MRLLVAVESTTTRSAVRADLREAGFEVVDAPDEARALEVARSQPIDAAVLDEALVGDRLATTVVRLLDARPQLFLVVLARHGAQPADRTAAFELGVDEYLIPPYTTAEIVARFSGISRRRQRAVPSALEIGELRIDTTAREVHVDGVEIPLARREYDLLLHLAVNAPVPFSRAELLEAAWESSASWQGTATVTEHVRRLRTKLGAAGVRIVTVAGHGYRFVPDVDTPPGARESFDDAEVVAVGTRIVHATPAAIDLLGLASAEDIVGFDLEDFVAASSLEAARRRLATRDQGRSPRPEQLALRRRGSDDLTVDVSTVPVDWQGEPASRITMWHVEAESNR